MKGEETMPVFVITKKTCLIIALFALLLLLGVVLILTLGGDKKTAKEQETSAMAEVECYELNVLPLSAKALPVYSVGRSDMCIALTIDAAWSTDKTQFILDTLKKYDIPATFFLCGVWVHAYPDYVKAIAEAGHEIGNHSLTHPHMNSLSEAQIAEELNKLNDEIEELTGKRCTLFRAPFGEYNDQVINTAHKLGFEVIQWSRDTIDWKEGRSAQTILDAVLPKLSSGDIILCHNNGYELETYLPKLIETAQAAGYRFVTVSELLLEGESSIDNNGVQQPKS